ncbi:hypothetical protein BDF19DRAFT_423765 [Syncephalis fuscata]|nr:hypothetical protein BDF19DRAFT_423765 [Syncephalis fuscata]
MLPYIVCILLALATFGAKGQTAPKDAEQKTATLSVGPHGLYGGCLDEVYKYAAYNYTTTVGFPQAIYLVTKEVYGYAVNRRFQDANTPFSIQSERLSSCVGLPGRAIKNCRIGNSNPVAIVNTTQPLCFLVDNTASNMPAEGSIVYIFKEIIKPTASNSNNSNNSNNNNNDKNSSTTSKPTSTSTSSSSPSSTATNSKAKAQTDENSHPAPLSSNTEVTEDGNMKASGNGSSSAAHGLLQLSSQTIYSQWLWLTALSFSSVTILFINAI